VTGTPLQNDLQGNSFPGALRHDRKQSSPGMTVSVRLR
jgi:hypothetical protein